MALIVARDFTERIADDIFKGAETKEEAKTMAGEIQEEIEFDLNTKLNNIAEERKEEQESIAQQKEFEERRADVSERSILQIITDSDSEIGMYCDEKISNDRLNKLKDHEANDVQLICEATNLDSDHDMDFDSDDEGYYNKYSICLPSKLVPYLQLRSYNSPYPVFEKQTKDMSLKELAAYCDTLLQTNVLIHDAYWIRFISQLAKQAAPEPKLRLAKKAISKPNRRLRSAK